MCCFFLKDEIFMIYTLKNDIITAKISEKGAEIISVIRNEDGCEYIWQGDSAYWSGQAPYLFPICGRLYGNEYTYDGERYEMARHGFARHSVFSLVSQSGTSVTLSLKSNEDIKRIYPFDFELLVTHTLEGEKLSVDVEIKNLGDKMLPAAFGAHPGFNVPLGEGRFEDYRIEFSDVCYPDELLCTPDGYNTGKKRAFPLKNGKIIELKHSLFDVDAVFMDNMARKVSLKSDVSPRGVTFSFPDMSNFGIWHKPQSDAPYVCLEPWCGLPSYQGDIDAFESKNNMFRIASNGEKTIHMELSFS